MPWSSLTCPSPEHTPPTTMAWGSQRQRLMLLQHLYRPRQHDLRQEGLITADTEATNLQCPSFFSCRAVQLSCKAKD